MDARERFEETGFLGPVRVFEPAECAEIARRLREAPAPPHWGKANAAVHPAYFEIARTPAIVDLVAGLLGDDVMIWGAILIERRPGQVHAWHTDIETSDPAGGTVSVWIGLENTNRDSALRLVTRSHRIGKSIQQRAAEAGTPRDAVGGEDALRWAVEHDPASEMLQPDMKNGDALFFDGRLWHGSHNTNETGTRRALLLQYARPSRPIRIPDFTSLEYPFRFRDDPLPPCVLLRGSGENAPNRLVPPPRPARVPAGEPWTREIEVPLPGDPETGWKPHVFRRGATPVVSFMGCHASVLEPGRSPHEPHRHDDEEILVALDGEATIVLEDDVGRRTEEVLEPGDFVHYPSNRAHTIRNDGGTPITYLMFRWRKDAGDPDSASGADGSPLETRIERFDAPRISEGRDRIHARRFSGPTRFLRALSAHVTRMAPGAGYEPHVDAYDVAFVVLEGAVETLGRTIRAPAVAYAPAGTPHGLRAVGEAPATYLVFEFHGEASPPPPKPLARRVKARIPAGVRALAPKPLRRAVRKALNAFG